jgi:hypothetical protein
MTSNPYKAMPFAFRVVILTVLVCAFPMFEIIQRSQNMQEMIRIRTESQQTSYEKLVDLRAKLEKTRKLTRQTDELSLRLSITPEAAQSEFNIADLIRSADEISARHKLTVESINEIELEPAQNSGNSYRGIKLTISGGFQSSMLFMHQLLKSQARVAIIDIDVKGDDPLVRYQELTQSSRIPEAKELEELSSVKTNALLRIVERI